MNIRAFRINLGPALSVLLLCFGVCLSSAEGPILPPLPDKVAGVKKPILDLGGVWQFSQQSLTGSRPIQVPGEWGMQGYVVPKGSWAVYERNLDIPADWQAKAARLRFDAVHSNCIILINNKEAGRHQGGFVPFEVDAASCVISGRNKLEVRVQCESLSEAISCISQYASHPVGGIIRKVRAYALPREAQITSLSSSTVLPASNEASFTVCVGVKASANPSNLTVKASLLAPNGNEAATPQVIDAKADNKIRLTIKNPSLWTNESPSLYRLKLTLNQDGKPLCETTQNVGLREIKVSANRLLVNGMPVKLIGVNRHEVHPLRGRSLTPELCREDAKLFKAANVNIIRTSHYPPSEEFLQACDELGIFVECEAAVCWINHGASPVWQTLDSSSIEVGSLIRQASQDMVSAYAGHPSILMWSLGNESLWSKNFEGALAQVHQQDPSRPVTFHDQCWGTYNNAGSKGDLANYHYPSESNVHMWSELSRPVWFGEFAHLQCYNRHELATDPGIREDWGRPFSRMVDLIWSQPGCVGGCVWSGIDDVFHLPDGSLAGYGHWGPIDAWRRPKPEYEGLTKALTPLKIIDSDNSDPMSTKLTVQNRFNFTSLDRAMISWKGGGRSGVIKSSLAPHATGAMIVPHGPMKPGERLELSLRDQHGVVRATEAWLPSGRPHLALPTKGAKLSIVKETGCLSFREFVLQPPIPMVLPLNAEGGAATEAGSKLQNRIDPFTPTTPGWRVASVESAAGGGALIAGEGDEVKGWIKIVPCQSGALVEYQLTLKYSLNPRQWGLVYSLPKSMDLLGWERRPFWSTGSPTALGRAKGWAKAKPSSSPDLEVHGRRPNGPYAQDSTPLGTNDFRSTRKDVTKVSLSGGGRSLLVFEATDPLHSRAWVEGESIKLLLAGFDTGGSDHFFATHYSAERRPLKAGDVIRAKFFLQLE